MGQVVGVRVTGVGFWSIGSLNGAIKIGWGIS